jgi:hypothetical protein
MLLRALLRRGRPLWPTTPRGILAVAWLDADTARTSAPPLERAASSTTALVPSGPIPTIALTYFGAGRIRRVALGPVGPRPQWERAIGLGGTVVGRFGGAALCEMDGMLVAVRLSNGEETWRLVGGPPLATASTLEGGDLLLEFAGGSWLRVRPVSGKRCDGGDGAGDARRLAGLRLGATPLTAPCGAVDGCKVGNDGDATVVAAPGQPSFHIAADGWLHVATRRLGRL